MKIRDPHGIDLCTQLCHVRVTKKQQPYLQILSAWAAKKILKVIDQAVRSEILKYLCMALLKNGGELSVLQLTYMFQDLGFSSVDTPYKLVNYIEKINERYDLPISFHYEGRYARFDMTAM